MAELTLYNMTSDVRKIGKSKSELHTFKNVKMVKGTDICSPILTCTVKNKTYLKKANYAYLDITGRYYFVDKIEFENNNIIKFYLSVDVLETYSAQIKNLTALVKRQENVYSMYIVDSELLTSCQRSMTFKTIGKLGNSTGAYIAITVAGGN